MQKALETDERMEIQRRSQEEEHLRRLHEREMENESKKESGEKFKQELREKAKEKARKLEELQNTVWTQKFVSNPNKKSKKVVSSSFADSNFSDSDSDEDITNRVSELPVDFESDVESESGDLEPENIGFELEGKKIESIDSANGVKKNRKIIVDNDSENEDD